MTVNIRVLPRFPAQVEATAGLAVARQSGIYTFSLGFDTLIPSTSIADPEKTYVASWNELDGSYTRLTTASLGQAMAFGFTGVSTTSLTIGTGPQVFTASTGRAWVIGQRLRAASDDGALVMSGTCTAYNPTTGALTIDVDYTLGSGVHADWNISVTGAQGETGAPGVGAGDVIGPAGSVDGVVALFDGATGKLIKEGAGALGALAYQAQADLATDVTGRLPFANIDQIATDTLLGRATAALGDIEVLSVGGGVELAASALQRSALTGDVTSPAGSDATTLEDLVVTFAKLAASIIATQGEAEAGTASDKLMTPERTSQAIAALGSASVGSELLASGTITDQSSLDIVLTGYTGYRKLVFELMNFRPSSNAQVLRARTSTNGGVSYDSGTNNYQWAFAEVDDSGLVDGHGSDGDNRIEMTQNCGNQSVEGATLTVELADQINTARYGTITWRGWFLSPTPTPHAITGGMGQRIATADIDAIRFEFAGGNIQSGSWAAYGLT